MIRISERSLFRKVSKEEKQAILRRFDVRNAKQVGVNFIIDIPCILCQKHKPDCETCPVFP